MELPSYTTFILSLTTQIDEVTKGFISNGYQQMAQYLERPVAVACVVLIALTGYAMMQGFIEMRTKEFNKLALSIGAIYLLAFGWAEFNAYFIGFFLDAANEISGVMIGGQTFQFPFLHGTGIGLNAALQTVLIESVKVGGWVMAKAGFTDWLPFLIGLMFILCGTVVVAIATIEVIIVKLYLAMLLAVAPFFISCLLFPQSKAQFDGWLNQLKGFSISLMLLGVVTGLCMYLMHWVVGGYYLEHITSIKLYSIVPLVIATLLCVLLLTGIIPIAKQIGGSHGGSGWGAVGGAIAGLATGAASTALKTAKAGKSAMGLQGAMGKGITRAAIGGSNLYSNLRQNIQRGK